MLTAHVSCGRTIADKANYGVPASGGVPEKLCDECGLPWDWSADHKRILHFGFKSSVVASMLNLETGKRECVSGASRQEPLCRSPGRPTADGSSSRLNSAESVADLRGSLYRATRARARPAGSRLRTARQKEQYQNGRLTGTGSTRSPTRTVSTASGRIPSILGPRGRVEKRSLSFTRMAPGCHCATRTRSRGASPSPGTELCSIKARSPATSG